MRSPLSMPGPWHAWAQYSQSIRSAICYLHTNLAHHISPLCWMSSSNGGCTIRWTRGSKKASGPGVQVLKDAPGLLWTIKQRKRGFFQKEEVINCCTRRNSHHVQPKISKKRHIISCQGELLCKRIRLNCRVGMMAVAPGGTEIKGLVWQHACRNGECLARPDIVSRDSRDPVKPWGAAGWVQLWRRKP